MKKVVQRGICFLLSLCIAASPASAQDNWDFVVAPYGLFPSISGDASVGRIDGADVDVDPGDILDSLELGAMIQVEAHHSSGFGLILNYSFMELGDDAKGPLGFTSFDADIFQGMLEGFACYRHTYDGGSVDVYAGARWWDIDLDIDATLAGRTRSFDNGASWVDPVIGTRWAPRIADDWRMLLQGDVGGFGVSSDFTWNVMGGFLWDASETMSLALLYRLLAVDYEDGAKGTPDRFAFDTNTQGPIIGAIFRF